MLFIYTPPLYMYYCLILSPFSLNRPFFSVPDNTYVQCIYSRSIAALEYLHSNIYTIIVTIYLPAMRSMKIPDILG